jgi:hypothetical protein
MLLQPQLSLVITRKSAAMLQPPYIGGVLLTAIRLLFLEHLSSHSNYLECGISGPIWQPFGSKRTLSIHKNPFVDTVRIGKDYNRIGAFVHGLYTF